jgi:hypothetical protein
MVSFMSQMLYSQGGKGLQYPLDRRQPIKTELQVNNFKTTGLMFGSS